MAVLVDVICSQCNERVLDKWSTMIGTKHTCGGEWERWWTLTRGLDPGTHPSDKVVVYQSLKEGGHIQYAMANNIPVPERLRQRGYERVELNVRDLASFEKKHHVANERRHYNRGNGF